MFSKSNANQRSCFLQAVQNYFLTGCNGMVKGNSSIKFEFCDTSIEYNVLNFIVPNMGNVKWYPVCEQH